MADFLRLIAWSLLCALCAVYTPRVQAQDCTQYKSRYGTDAWQSSGESACHSDVAWANGINNGNTYSFQSFTAPTTCRMLRQPGAVVDVVSILSRTGAYCNAPPPSECPRAQTLLDAQIPSVYEGLTQAAAAAFARNAARGQFGECSNGCTIRRTLASCGGIGNSWRCEMYGGEPVQGNSCGGNGSCNLIGNACQPYTPDGAAGTPTVQLAPDPVPGGYCPGEVNGVRVYVKCDRTIGSDISTTVSTTGSGTLSITSTGETVCSGTTCTTTVARTSTSTVTGGSSTTATGSTTQVLEKATFCRDNPTHPACKDTEQTRFGGSCNSAFTCSGDAAMCATAKAVNETNCALSKTSAESSLYESEKAKTGNQTTALPGNETVALGPGSFSQTNLLGSAQCIPDLTVTVMSKSITLPFSDVCPWLEHLGNLLVSVSLLASIRIVSRG